MSVVGAFPGIADWRRRTIRMPTNPMDKATVVSIYPKVIEEKKVTLEPGIFVIPAGKYESPATLVVGPSSWWREIDEGQPLLEIPVSSILVAESIVRDYMNGLFMCNMGNSTPGLFYVAGEHDAASIKKNFTGELDKALAKQRKWYENLVGAADAMWARSNGNPLTILEDARQAARELGIEATKDWMKTFTMVNMTRCKACGTLKNPDFPICATCHFPDPDHPMTKQLLEMRQKQA